MPTIDCMKGYDLKDKLIGMDENKRVVVELKDGTAPVVSIEAPNGTNMIVIKAYEGPCIVR